MAQVVLGVSGGIASYKAAHLLRLLKENGNDVRVVPTENALRFVGAATFEALSGHPTRASVWDDVPAVPHVQLGREAELVVVAPATADLLARAAHGHADDLLTALLLTARCPIVYCPAMHTEMWEHPATQSNVERLRSWGAVVLPPATGRLTGTDSGAGRLPDPEDIEKLLQVVQERGATGLWRDLEGVRVVISAGGTREVLDPVRYLGNRSTGKQGWALARVAVARGADVTLVAANVEREAPFGVRTLQVESAAELREAMLEENERADVVVMCAAVADHRAAQKSETKQKKGSGGRALQLVENPDILAELSRAKQPGQVVVGFAAETGDEDGDPLAHGRAKLEKKGCDLLVVNDVSAGQVFGKDESAAVVLEKGGRETLVQGSKDAMASRIWDLVGELRGGRVGTE